MATRYDDFIEFRNANTEVFIGRWDQEDYIIEPGMSQMFPAWLAKHFAKRLCDQVMIKEFGTPLTNDSPERTKFIKQCINVDLNFDYSKKKERFSQKAQIVRDQQKKAMSIEEQEIALQTQLDNLRAMRKENKETESKSSLRRKEVQKQAENELKEEAKQLKKRPMPSIPNPTGSRNDDNISIEGDGDSNAADMALRTKVQKK